MGDLKKKYPFIPKKNRFTKAFENEIKVEGLLLSETARFSDQHIDEICTEGDERFKHHNSVNPKSECSSVPGLIEGNISHPNGLTYADDADIDADNLLHGFHRTITSGEGNLGQFSDTLR